MTTVTGHTSTLGPAVEALNGKIVFPDHADWGTARLAWNLAVDQRPAAVVHTESSEDVIAAVQLARALGLRVAAQGTGHNAAPLGPLDDTILVKTEQMRRIEIDPKSRIARVEAGVRTLELVEAAARHGLAPLLGSSPDVGVVGYTLGGGLSWFGRKHGLASSGVHAIELVTADGSRVRTDRDHEPDLFWALRGGGGDFGVVTALELQLVQAAEVYAGILWWPIDREQRGPARLGRDHPQRTAGRAHHGRTLPPAATRPAHPRADQGQIVRRRRGRAPRRPRVGRRAPRPAPRARTRAGHDPKDLDAGAHPDAHGSRATRPRYGRRPAAAVATGGGGRASSYRSRAPLRPRRSSRSSYGTSAAS